MIPLSSHIREIVIQAGHKGLTRTMKNFIEKENLPAKDWPAYIKKEFFEKILLKERPGYVTREEAEDALKNISTPQGIKSIKELYISFPKEPVVLDLKIDGSDFIQDSRNKLTQRMNLKPYEELSQVPHDTERHKKQHELLKDFEYNPIPVILLAKSGKYEIREGWHRIMELIKKAIVLNLPSFKLNAYIGTEKKQDPSLLNRMKEFFKSVR